MLHTAFTFAAALSRLPPRHAVGRALTLLLIANSFASAQPLASESPFVPHAGASAVSATADTTYEFVGMTTIGNETLISITRTKDKVSTWIPVGKTVSEITAVSYDPRSDQAVIRASGQTLALTLRKANVVVGPLASPLVSVASRANLPPGGPMSDSAIVAGLPTKPISAQEQKEFEARMMVSDLLEIGQQQRRAYEEAQRKAAAHAPKPLPTTMPVTAPNPATPTASAAGAH